jgi:hypothetical protein
MGVPPGDEFATLYGYPVRAIVPREREESCWMGVHNDVTSHCKAIVPSGKESYALFQNFSVVAYYTQACYCHS